MPGDFRCDRGDYARVLTSLIAREASGASSARHSLRPLFRRARDSCTARAIHAAGTRRCVWWIRTRYTLTRHRPAWPGDPVFQRRLRIIERPRRTGSSGQAGRRQLCGKRQGNHQRRPRESRDP